MGYQDVEVVLLDHLVHHPMGYPLFWKALLLFEFVPKMFCKFLKLGLAWKPVTQRVPIAEHLTKCEGGGVHPLKYKCCDLLVLRLLRISGKLLGSSC